MTDTLTPEVLAELERDSREVVAAYQAQKGECYCCLGDTSPCGWHSAMDGMGAAIAQHLPALVAAARELERMKAENARLRDDVDRQSQWRAELSAQILVLGQCVNCGELDHQDGVRRGNKFYCCGPEVVGVLGG